MVKKSWRAVLSVEKKWHAIKKEDSSDIQKKVLEDFRKLNNFKNIDEEIVREVVKWRLKIGMLQSFLWQ